MHMWPLIRVQRPNTPPDARDNAIGTANRANVHRLMSSLAVFPFAQALK